MVRKKDTQGIQPLKRRNGNGVAQSKLEKAEEFNGQWSVKMVRFAELATVLSGVPKGTVLGPLVVLSEHK